MLFKCKVCAWEEHSKTSRQLAVENGDVTADSYSPKENLLTATVQWRWRARRLISFAAEAMLSEQASRSIGIEIERQQRKLHAYAFPSPREDLDLHCNSQDCWAAQYA